MEQSLRFKFLDFTEEQLLPALSRLQENVIHIWRRRILPDPEFLQRGKALLSEDEAERASRYRVQHAQNAYILTRTALRVLLGRYLDASPQSIRFRLTEYGKPLLDGASELHFNVSHTEGLALLAFTQKRRIGVDVEKIRPQPDALKLARRFFSKNEQQQLESLSVKELPSAFFRCWSRKEAYIKARGEGLSLPLNRFDVSAALAPSAILLATRPDSTEAQQWVLRDVPVPSEYAAAVAVSVVSV
jgi:4'-phosphopantetheinyl transferase